MKGFTHRAVRKLFLMIICMFFHQGKIISQDKKAEPLINNVKENDLCALSKKGVEAANFLAHDTSFLSAVIDVQYTTGDKREHSITFGKSSENIIIKSPITNGDSTNGKVDSNWPGAFADIHNHPNDQPPSAGDLYYLIKLNIKNHFYDTRFIVTKNGTIYALYVYNLKLANDFIDRYPLEQTPGFSPRFPEPIFDDVDKISTYFEGEGVDRLTARERALAFILSKYNSGVALLKQDNSENFKAMQTEERTLKGLKNYYANNCD